jgi:hypothetical protein
MVALVVASGSTPAATLRQLGRRSNRRRRQRVKHRMSDRDFFGTELKPHTASDAAAMLSECKVGPKPVWTQ